MAPRRPCYAHRVNRLIVSLLFGASLLLAQDTPPPPDRAAKTKLVEELFVAMHFDSLISTMRENMRTQLTDTFRRAFPPGVRDQTLATIVDEMMVRFAKIDYRSTALAQYRDTFTNEELIELTRFYRTPIGQSIMKKVPEVTAQLFKAGQQEGEKIGREVVERHLDEIRADLQAAKPQPPQ